MRVLRSGDLVLGREERGSRTVSDVVDTGELGRHCVWTPLPRPPSSPCHLHLFTQGHPTPTENPNYSGSRKRDILLIFDALVLLLNLPV